MTATLTTTTPPVVVTGRLDEHLSRWLWLVKWLLALPHFLALALLWPVFLVATVVAGVAILVTGRYPRALFELNAGVLRWTWRVHYYAYGALGTDRYPPFTLRDVPDYPARLLISYPEHLSRGLVLVKWWLLALPHYLVVALFVGGGWWALGSATAEGARVQAPGLIGLLVLVAGISLAFSGRYPRPLFDLVVGLDRWVLRVAAYAGLMTDVYPPFRLDTGGSEPAARVVEVEQRSGTKAQPPSGSGGSSSPGGTLAIVLGALLLLPAVGLLAGGAAALGVHSTQRDAAGYLVSEPVGLATTSAALVTEPLDLRLPGPDGLYVADLVGDVRLRVSTAADQPVFLGIGRAADVDRYLAGVEHDVLREVRGPAEVSYTRRSGGTEVAPPAEQGFWLAGDTGSGTVTVASEPVDGQWTAVVMDPDGARGLAVTADVGVTAPVLPWIAVGLLLSGALLAAAGAVLLAVGMRTLSPRATV